MNLLSVSFSASSVSASRCRPPPLFGHSFFSGAARRAAASAAAAASPLLPFPSDLSLPPPDTRFHHPRRAAVGKDNSGRGNIFPTSQKAYYRSATAESVASEGLGGAQGGLVLVAAVGLVGLALAGILKSGGSGETLSTVAGSFQGDSLSAIAARIAATL